MSILWKIRDRPTPGAVLLAGELWANGTRNQEGFGDVLMIDVGGATTDIHSVLPGVADLRDEEIGLIINNEKQASYRTVEGNLGMRVSATGIVDAVGAESLEQIVNTLDPDNEIEFENLEMIEEYAREREKNTELIAEANWEDKLDQALAIAAIHVSLKTTRRIYCSGIQSRYRCIAGIPSWQRFAQSQISPRHRWHICQPCRRF